MLTRVQLGLKFLEELEELQTAVSRVERVPLGRSAAEKVEKTAEPERHGPGRVSGEILSDIYVPPCISVAQ